MILRTNKHNNHHNDWFVLLLTAWSCSCLLLTSVVHAQTTTTTGTALASRTSTVPVHPDILAVVNVAGERPGGRSWADSYSVGNRCYCRTSFDHNIGIAMVETPLGWRSVQDVCGLLGRGPGWTGRPIYNDVQCGNGPPNDAGDEQTCPGRTDLGRPGCGHIGPRWNFDQLIGKEATTNSTTIPPPGAHADIVAVVPVAGVANPRQWWADSYSVGDSCFCMSNLEHGINVTVVETPLGWMSVKEVCDLLGPGPGFRGRPKYNDIQCGNGPQNDVGNEMQCPGRSDIGPDGCGQIGPKWNFAAAVPTIATLGDTPAPAPRPTRRPVTPVPTPRPTRRPVTPVPTPRPTRRPVTPLPTPRPTRRPVTPLPTPRPTRRPVTPLPTPRPTLAPVTTAPTTRPTLAPVTTAPTTRPTLAPVTTAPTPRPTQAPVTTSPTTRPSQAPVTTAPTQRPTLAPVTTAPTQRPTLAPVTTAPTQRPTLAPVTTAPTTRPTLAPVTTAPTQKPSTMPPTQAALTLLPTTSNSTGGEGRLAPGTFPPSSSPSVTASTTRPSDAPSSNPSISPSDAPSLTPSTSSPSTVPSPIPTAMPSTKFPTHTPSLGPTVVPTQPSGSVTLTNIEASRADSSSGVAAARYPCTIAQTASTLLVSSLLLPTMMMMM